MKICAGTLGRPPLLLGFAALLLAAAANHSAAQAPASRTAAHGVQANLATFDDLDFNVFSNQKWDQLSRSHAKDILVHWPDGHTTTGIEKHIEDLRAMFVYAPDTRIRVHPVKFGSGEWTSVIGEMEGTFTKPMPAGDGKTIAPTGKAFKLPMCTVGRWKNGVMVEEYLFWDNQTYMKQLGL
jgi:SnoaL-like polyketide cyclase